MITEVFRLHDEWLICFKGAVLKPTWEEKGPALAQLELLKNGYSVVTTNGGIKHIGKENR